MSWDIGILDFDWFKFRPMKIEIKKVHIRNKRKISREKNNLKFLCHKNLLECGQFCSFIGDFNSFLLSI
jgi:hypothetical protein